jgi:hypothetical protein
LTVLNKNRTVVTLCNSRLENFAASIFDLDSLADLYALLLAVEAVDPESRELLEDLLNSLPGESGTVNE